MSTHAVLSVEPGPSGTGALESPVQAAFVSRFMTFGEPMRARRIATIPTDGAQARLRLQEPPRTTARTLDEIDPPPLPQAYLALRRAVENPMATGASVGNVIATDPALAAYVLRLANSPLYSPSAPVETISRAVALIGLAEIETMAAGTLLHRLATHPPRADLLSLGAFWRHAVAVGMLAQTLAERAGEQGRERFFVAGLLHDVGRLLLAVAEPDLTAISLLQAVEAGTSMDAAERQELGFDHASLGGRIAAKWRLPGQLTEAVAGHHQPWLCPDSLLATAVHVADFIANALGERATPSAGLPRLDARALAPFELERAEPGEFQEILVSGLAAMTTLFAA